MVKIRTLVPLTHPSTGENFAAGTEVDVADDVAAEWKADGKISLISDEQAAEERTKAEGSYSARVGREDVASTKTEQPKAEEAKEPKKK